MLALIYYGNRNIALKDIKKPKVKENEILLKVSNAGLCQTQINEFIEGPLILNTEINPLTNKALPLIVGHEFGGIVEEVGKSVDSSLLGTQVAVLPALSCGECQWCKQGDEQLCDTQAYYGLTGENGGFAEYAIIHKDNIFPLENKSLLTFLEPILVAIHFARKIEKKLDNAKVLILGAGAIGISSAVVLKELFNAHVDINEILPERTKRAREAGLNMLDKSELTQSAYDIIIDCAGTNFDSSVEPAFAEAFKYLNKKGTLVMIGTYFHAVPIMPISILAQEQIIIGSYAYNKSDSQWLEQRIDNIKFDFSKIIDEIALENIIEEGYYRGEVDKDSFSRIVITC